MSKAAVPTDALPTVHVVEDDDSSRKATVRVLLAAGYAVRDYLSGAEFLRDLPSGPGCAVLDLRLPGMSGLALQERLALAGNPLPVVFLTGHGDIPKTVQAMRAGPI